MSKQNQLKNRVYKFWENNKLRGKRFVVNHFQAENKSVRTIYHLIREAENQVPLERKKGPVVVGTKSNIKQLTQMFDHKTGCSHIFYSSDTNLTAENVKYSKKAKYEKKIMIWIAISPMGVSQPYYVPSGMAINKETYLKKCIQERLMPFYKKYHQHTKTVFWPDLASSHYATVVQNYFREQKSILCQNVTIQQQCQKRAQLKISGRI